MSEEQTPKAPAPEAEVEAADPIESLFDYVQRNWKELVGGVAIAVIIVAGVQIYQTRTRHANEQAFNQLAIAASASQFSEIKSQFPASKAADMAALMAARAQYDAANYAEADQQYADFLKENPGHFLAPAARLGRIHCQEALGQLEEARQAFHQFAQDNPSETAFVTLARLGEARCLRQLGKLPEAVAVYETILLEHPQSDWKPLVEDLKLTTSRELEQLNAPAKPAA